MNLLADESVARVLIERLRTDGHTVLAVGEASPGVADTQVLEEAGRTRFVLLTEDKDFGELVYRRGASHHGVVLIRLAGLSRGSGRACFRSVQSPWGRIRRRVHRYHVQRHSHSSARTVGRRNRNAAVELK